MYLDSENLSANLVEIVNITHKDGTPLEQDNWRQKLIGRVTLCCLAGGFDCLTPFFEFDVRLEDGKVKEIDLDWEGNASAGVKIPIEVEPGVYDFESDTSIYRFRLLDQDESEMVLDAIREACLKEAD